jgi:cell division ATPase FtsA
MNRKNEKQLVVGLDIGTAKIVDNVGKNAPVPPN